MLIFRRFKAIVPLRFIPGNMRRLFSISVVLALVVSAAAPDLVSAYVMGSVPMMCHRSGIHDSGPAGMTHLHCHDMEGMDSAPGAQDGSGAIIRRAGTECPMECCALAGPAGMAITASALILTTPVVIEGNASISKVIFGRSGFSSHTDRGPPAA